MHALVIGLYINKYEFDREICLASHRFATLPHLIINECGELLAFYITLGNVDDRKPVPKMVKGLTGKLFGDRDYLSQSLFEQLFQEGIELFTTSRSNIKNRFLNLYDKILLRERSISETVNEQLKIKLRLNILAMAVLLTLWYIW